MDYVQKAQMYVATMDPEMVPKPMDAVVFASVLAVWWGSRWLWRSPMKSEKHDLADDLELARKAIQERDDYIGSLMEELCYYKSEYLKLRAEVEEQKEAERKRAIIDNTQTPPFPPELEAVPETMADIALPASVAGSVIGTIVGSDSNSIVTDQEQYTTLAVEIMKFLKNQPQPKSVGEIHMVIKQKGFMHGRLEIENALAELKNANKIVTSLGKMYSYAKSSVTLPMPPTPTRFSARLASKSE